MPGGAYLRGDRITLRTIETEDAEFVQKGRNNPEIRIPLGTYGPENLPSIEDDIEKMGERERNITLLICLERPPRRGDGDEHALHAPEYRVLAPS